MRDITALVEHYLHEWDSREWAHAYHSLIEPGPQVLPELQRRFHESRDAAFRAALVEHAVSADGTYKRTSRKKPAFREQP